MQATLDRTCRRPFASSQSCKPARSSIVARATTYKVTLRTPSGDRIIKASSDKYLLESAKEANIDVPMSCEAGCCGTCVSKIVSGEVDNWDQSYLDPQETSQGFMLLCSAFPRSDLVITTHQQAPYAVAAKSLK